MEGFADYESEDEDAQPPAPVLPSDDSDSEKDESSEDEREVDPNMAAQRKAESDTKESVKEALASKEPQKKRISAASALLSSTSKPEFLNPTSKCEAFDLRCDEKEDNSETKANAEPPAKRQAVAATPDQASMDSTSLTKAAPRHDSSNKNKKEKDVKDRVKTQRLRGQSAHATWKSEVRLPFCSCQSGVFKFNFYFGFAKPNSRF